MKKQGSTDVPDVFVKTIREKAKEAGISLRQLAFRADMDPATLSRILSGHQNLPPNDTILRLAEVLEIQPPERLLADAGRSGQRLQPLLRAASELNKSEFDQVMKVMERLAKKKRSKRRVR